MIAWLVRRTWGRILLAPVVIACGFWSWIGFFTTKNLQDQRRFGNCWGWLDPRLEPQWALFSTSTDSAYELLKNMGSEWAKLDGQRAYKAMSFLMVIGTVVPWAIALAVMLALSIFPGRP